jgi:uncharacterized membrane protein YfcA
VDTAFLGVPDVDAWLFAGLALASFCTTILGILWGAAGGVLLLAILALFFPPAILVPVHTFVQLGGNAARATIMRRYVMRGAILPFAAGAALGAAAGGLTFISLPTVALQGILGGFILFVTWMPRFGRMGSERNRFALLGLGATFLGMFVSATGNLVTPFVASASPDRRNHVATLSALMTVSHLAKLIAFGVLGVALAAYLPLVAAMIATATAGSWVGFRLLHRMPERGFRIILQAVLTVLALRLLWSAAAKAGWL